MNKMPDRRKFELLNFLNIYSTGILLVITFSLVLSQYGTMYTALPTNSFTSYYQMTASIEQSYCHTITYPFRSQSISYKMFWLCQRLVNYVVLIGICCI